MTMDREAALRKLLGRVFDNGQEGLRKEIPADEYERRRHDFVFHMTDWLKDLTDYADMVEHPEKWKLKEATEFLIGFLYHVVPHLSAAGRLLLDEIKDPFAKKLAPRTGPKAKSVV
jgi:hypothetical protein